MTFQPPYKGCSDGPRWGYGDIQMANIIKHHAYSKWDHASSFIRQKKICECAIMETALYAHFLSSACPYCSMSYISMYFKGKLAVCGITGKVRVRRRLCRKGVDHIALGEKGPWGQESQRSGGRWVAVVAVMLYTIRQSKKMETP